MEMWKDEEARRALAECILQEKIESGEITPPRSIDCPFCYEKISAKARKCPYCQSILDESLLPRKDILDVTLSFAGSLLRLCIWVLVIGAFALVFMFLILR